MAETKIGGKTRFKNLLTIIPFVLVGYEVIITNSRCALVGYFITSYPTRAHGIIVIYPSFTIITHYSLSLPIIHHHHPSFTATIHYYPSFTITTHHFARPLVFLSVFFPVTRDGLNERGTSSWLTSKPSYRLVHAVRFGWRHDNDPSLSSNELSQSRSHQQ